jgi:signal transduction histidine kinase
MGGGREPREVDSLVPSFLGGGGLAMQITESDLEPVRDRTDSGLDEERAKTDLALAGTTAEERLSADAELEASRAAADEVIRARRELSDARLRDGQAGAPQVSALVDRERRVADRDKERERTLADSIVEHERQRVDDVVRVEREDRRLVDERLGTERAETDDRLRLERERTDEVVDDASALLFYEQAAHARAKQAVIGRDERLALVSHELRNPLAAIVMNAQALLDASPADLATTRIAEDVQAACASMSRLVSDLLDVTSIELGRLQVNLVPGDATGVLRDALAAVAPLVETRSLSVVTHLPQQALPARFDHGRIQQVFANLFANSVKFTAPGGTISVDVDQVGRSLRFCVSDTGCGIPSEDLFHVFDRFWQVGGVDKRGLGLGLYVCKAIVEAHGGKIWAASNVGVGSKFYFTLPQSG